MSAAANEPSKPRRAPHEELLDQLVFAPLALFSRPEDRQRLAAHGRAMVESQVALARVVGQVVVQGVTRRLTDRFDSARGSEPTRPFPPASDREADSEASAPTPGASGTEAGRHTSALAIVGYDTLTASQIVPQLAGLDRTQLDAIAEYESARRGRKTILNRIAQLR